MAFLAELVISRKENPRKCTLTPFRGDPRFRIVYHVPSVTVVVEGHILLHPDGPPLSGREVEGGIVLVDASWKHFHVMLRDVRGNFVPRCLPAGIVTAYPRCSKRGTDPHTGLASIEALYAALSLAGRETEDLLARYYWRDLFLSRNAAWFASHRPRPEATAPSPGARQGEGPPGAPP